MPANAVPVARPSAMALADIKSRTRESGLPISTSLVLTGVAGRALFDRTLPVATFPSAFSPEEPLRAYALRNTAKA
jgi:hypothetical protein